MTNEQKIQFLAQKASTRQFLAFVYTKANGEKSSRTIQIGIDIPKKFEKEGRPLIGAGQWMTGHRAQSWLISRKGKQYIQGSEIKGDLKIPKIFALDGISDLK